MFLFGISMLIYIPFNLHVLHGICNSLQDKDTSHKGCYFTYGNIVMKTKNCFSLADQLMKLMKTAVTHIPTYRILNFTFLFDGDHFK